jgi:hypothetical protein
VGSITELLQCKAFLRLAFGRRLWDRKNARLSRPPALLAAAPVVHSFQDILRKYLMALSFQKIPKKYFQ